MAEPPRRGSQRLLVRKYLARSLDRPGLPFLHTTAEPVERRVERPAGTDRLPTTVVRALAFIEEEAGNPIGLTEIAEAAQISPRALQAAFRRHLQTTPLGHLRLVRMGRAHADLRSAVPGDQQTVSFIANAWGFSQLGRFARDYKRRYGVSPRETLRRPA